MKWAMAIDNSDWTGDWNLTAHKGQIGYCFRRGRDRTRLSTNNGDLWRKQRRLK
jgi:hypothetical protein